MEKTLSKKKMSKEPETIDFISNCPFPGCLNAKKIIRWTHSDCGGRLKLSIDGSIRCIKCKEKNSFLNWEISCGNDHIIADLTPQEACQWLGQLALFAPTEEDAKLLAKITMSIMNELAGKLTNK